MVMPEKAPLVRPEKTKEQQADEDRAELLRMMNEAAQGNITATDEQVADALKYNPLI